MRIAVANWTSRNFGGAEAYLDTILPALARAGCDTALLSEVDTPADRARILLSAESPRWCIAELGLSASLDALRRWTPNVLYVHEVTQPRLEQELLKVAPAVLFAHNYHGTCISGAKLTKFPVATPCSRRFGPQCLMHYFPKRCGGLSPLTMLSLYREQLERRTILEKYRMILTASDHMRLEYVRNGLVPEAVRTIYLPIAAVSEPDNGNGKPHAPASDAAAGLDRPWRLTFAGRMTLLKGGAQLVDSLAQVWHALRRPIAMTFAGDGPERTRWEAAAGRAQARHPAIQVSFSGWMSAVQVQALFAASDLLVIPSLWPEPFGLVGPEAGLHGVPAAGFAVGGIPEWLIDGINGHLAPGDPPTAAGLAQAVVKCLRDPTEYQLLRRNASKMAARFSVGAHISSLLRIFEEAIGCRPQLVAAGSPALN